MNRYVIAALLAPAAVFLGLVIIGGKRFDSAGLALVRPQVGGTALAGLPVPSNLTIGAVGVALLAAYLTR